MCVMRQRVIGQLVRSFNALELGGNSSCHLDFSVAVLIELEHACDPSHSARADIFSHAGRSKPDDAAEPFDSHDVDLVAVFRTHHIQDRRDPPPHCSWRHDRQCRQ